MSFLRRAYLPVSSAQLRELAQTRRLAPPLTGFSVTEALRATHPGTDGEELEHLALQQAAKAGLESGRPVIVVAADVDGIDSAPTAAAPQAALVQVSGEVRVARVAAIHVGDELVGGRPVLGLPGQVELSWYDTTELEHLVSLL